MDLENDKDKACKEIEAIIKTLCKKYSLKPIQVRLRRTPDYQNGGVQWDGTVGLTIGT